MTLTKIIQPKNADEYAQLVMVFIISAMFG
jgi:hypothetical protein